ncbi:MAG: LON peptidase substrate-binding domain-containing protein [SAR324 cluster bacterium]|nr:LON peptidase substrate-binding domain-containing protein [SAR324 cluster bacterium]
MNEGYSTQIPLFPLYGTILLPKTILPLNIFEPRYKQMLEHALENDSLLGLIQPVEPGGIPLFETGCLGKVEWRKKLPNGNSLIRLHGLIRFSVKQELTVETLYRQAIVDYSAFYNDLEDGETMEDSDDTEFFEVFEAYVLRKKIQIDWTKIKSISRKYLINLLCMNLDFMGIEKQALLESPNLISRREDLLSLMRMDQINESSDMTSQALN